MKYIGLQSYIREFKDNTGLNIVIKDFIDIFRLDEELFNAVQEFYVHKQPYCMYIKGNSRLWDYCLLEKTMIYEKLVKDPRPFFGACYAGINEYVVPILYQSQVIAAVTVGSFGMDPEKLQPKQDRLVKSYHMDLDVLQEHYEMTAVKWQETIQVNLEKITIIAEYLSLAYGNLLKNKGEDVKLLHDSGKSYILVHALEYIKQHYKEEINLEMIAGFCHCSKSYISHQFKNYTHQTLGSYINSLRINEAKELLKKGCTVTETAFLVGYRDSNYFTKVFRQMEKLTPSAFADTVEGSSTN